MLILMLNDAECNVLDEGFLLALLAYLLSWLRNPPFGAGLLQVHQGCARCFSKSTQFAMCHPTSRPKLRYSSQHKLHFNCTSN